MSLLPVQEPMTGNEDLGDRSSPAQALAEFYRAFNTRDLALMSANWDPSAEAAMDNALGGIARGCSEIRAVYERIFDGPARVHVEFHDYTLHIRDFTLLHGRSRAGPAADTARRARLGHPDHAGLSARGGTLATGSPPRLDG